MPPSTSPPRVLVVDDHPESAESLALLLEMSGFETRFAEDGLTGLGVALEFRPHAALLDLSMPGLGGLALARRIRSTPEIDRTILIGLSGHRLRTEEAEAAGFDRYLTKPIELAQLLEVLRSLPEP